MQCPFLLVHMDYYFSVCVRHYCPHSSRTLYCMSYRVRVMVKKNVTCTLYPCFVHTKKIKKNGCIGSKLRRWNESDIHLNIGQLILWGMKISKTPKPSWIDTASAFVETYLDPFQCMAVKNGGSVLQKEI